MADKFVLKTPKGELVKVRTPNGEVKMEIRWNPKFGPSMTQRINSAQAFIDTECLKLCDPLVPKDTGILKQSGIMHTSIGSGELNIEPRMQGAGIIYRRSSAKHQSVAITGLSG